MNIIKKLIMSAKEVFPLIEGGKGIGVTNGITAGSWAAAGGIGTFSGVNADFYDADGKLVPIVYHGKTRQERHEELIEFGIRGGIEQAKIANDIAGDNGRIHMNILWEMGGAQRILEGILDKAKGLIHGVTCGAGMPYKLAEIATKYKVHYYPIVSSARAFNALWKRSYSKLSDFLGAVVYEDPWKAGGHNGLSNSEDPLQPQDPYGRVVELRKLMNSFGLALIPIVMAGGVWQLSEWKDWIDNPEISPIAFQFGTRPLLTQESPIPLSWKQKLLTLKKGDVFLNKFSPTGFYSSAVQNAFLQDLIDRSNRQVAYSSSLSDIFSEGIPLGPRQRIVYFKPEDVAKVMEWTTVGFTEGLRTPDETMVFVTPENAAQILQDQINCMGCLSACQFSNWAQEEPFTTGRKPDPRSFCIQKTLQDSIHTDNIDHNLMFAGHNAYRFATDPFYANGAIPTVKQLVDRILTGA
jgi:NAD(P)H-dependent flavin oxidoreductase YrpB (nitropropane dioxygenase family)